MVIVIVKGLNFPDKTYLANSAVKSRWLGAYL